jgi:uncharacterized membrane protein
VFFFKKSVFCYTFFKKVFFNKKYIYIYMSIVGYGVNSSKISIPLYWENSNAIPTPMQVIGGAGGSASSINNVGQIVGSASKPLYWNNHKVKPVTLQLPDGDFDGNGSTINNKGEIVGYYIYSDQGFAKPLYWNNSTAEPTTLTLLNDDENGFAAGINDLGQIVGTSNNVTNYALLPIIWAKADAKPTKLQLLNNTTEGNATSINNSGQIVGFSTNIPIYWSTATAKPIKLQILDGYVSGFALGINNLGQIVGSCSDGTNYVAITWADAMSKPTRLKVLEGYTNLRAYGISDPPTPTPTPMPVVQSNICFPAGTPIKTDQGEVAIEKLVPGKHTLGRQAITHITQTTSIDKYLVLVGQDAFAKNKPSRPTVMSKDHKVEYEGELVPVYRFLGYLEKVNKLKYSGELLYNVLLETYGTMSVNNLRCETLEPTSPIACVYRGVAYKKVEKGRFTML